MVEHWLVRYFRIKNSHYNDGKNPYYRGGKMADNENQTTSPVVEVIATVGGVVSGGCAAVVTVDILDSLLPVSSSVAKTIAYGVGCVTVGGLVGTAVTNGVRDNLSKKGEAMLELKSGITKLIGGN
jgi:hypothetical protein